MFALHNHYLCPPTIGTHNSSLFLTAVLLLLGFLSAAKGDACYFNVTYSSGVSTVSVASYSAVQNCFAAVPFSATFRDETVAVLNQLFNLYSFTDIVANSGAPWNLQVNVWDELNRINSTVYSSDYAMVADIQTFFNKLYDAHTQYTAPPPYAGWTLLRPFSLATNWTFTTGNKWGNLVFTVDSEPTFEGKTFTDIYELAFNGSQPPVNISSVIGKIVTQINGMPTLDYLQLVADSQGTFKSAGVRLNSILKGGFVSTTANTAPLSNGFETYTFSDGTTADFSGGLPVIYNSIPFANIANLQALVVPRIKVVNVRGEEEESFNNKIKMAVRKMSPFEEQRRNQELEERLSLPLSSLKTLNVSLENSVIAGSIILNGVEHVVLQITTFGPAPATANNATLFKAWLLSFQAAIKAAVDYGQTQGINNLIIDLTGNPGGVICLSVATRIALFPGYAANPGSASCPSDYRLSTINQYASVPYVLNNGEEVPQCSTTTISDNRSWFYPLANHTRGGITSAYTNLFGLDCFNGGNNMLYSNPAYLNWTPTWFFSKVIALTDGTCGSACSQFLSEAMADGTVTAISYGGRPDSVTDTSSFCGGNVEDWTLFVPKANAVSATTQMTFSNLPTTATMNFNFMESYVSGGSLPREFTQMPATANLNIWPVFSKDITDTLYGQAVAYFASAITSPTTLQCKIDVAGNTLTAVSTTSSPASGVQSSFVETLRQLF